MPTVPTGFSPLICGNADDAGGPPRGAGPEQASIWNIFAD